MLRVTAIFLLIFISVSAFTQSSLVCEKSLQTGLNKNNKFSKEFFMWLEKQNVMEVLFNNKADSITAKGKFCFESQVTYPGSATISRTYNSQTNGTVYYKITILCRADHYQIKLYDFEHKPTSQSEPISFGKITSSETAPSFLIMDYDEGWCNGVWKSLQEQCQAASVSLMIHLQNEIAVK